MPFSCHLAKENCHSGSLAKPPGELFLAFAIAVAIVVVLAGVWAACS